MLRRELGRLPESLSALRAAVGADPACPDHAVALANLLAEIGAIEEGLFALHTFERQIGALRGLSPKYPETVWLGRADSPIGTEHVVVLGRGGAVLQAGHPMAQPGHRVCTRLGVFRKNCRTIPPQIDLRRSGGTLAIEGCGRHG